MPVCTLPHPNSESKPDQTERDGLITRTVHPVAPPKVEYKLTQLGMSLGAAFCGVWIWAAEHFKQVEQARRKFDQKGTTG